MGGIHTAVLREVHATKISLLPGGCGGGCRGRAVVLAVTRRPVSAESAFYPWSDRARCGGTQIGVGTDLSNSAGVSGSFRQCCILSHPNVYESNQKDERANPQNSETKPFYVAYVGGVLVWGCSCGRLQLKYDGTR